MQNTPIKLFDTLLVIGFSNITAIKSCRKTVESSLSKPPSKWHVTTDSRKRAKKNLMKIAVRSKDIKTVRGKGLFIGIEVKHGNAKMFCLKLLEFGIIVNDCHSHTIRFSPPNSNVMDLMRVY